MTALFSIPIMIALAVSELIFGVTPQEWKLLERKGRAELLRTMAH